MTLRVLAQERVFHGAEMRMAEKSHQCFECMRVIRKGDIYWHWWGNSTGDQRFFSGFSYCDICFQCWGDWIEIANIGHSRKDDGAAIIAHLKELGVVDIKDIVQEFLALGLIGQDHLLVQVWVYNLGLFIDTFPPGYTERQEVLARRIAFAQMRGVRSRRLF